LIDETVYTIKVNSSCTDFHGNYLDGNRNTVFEGSPNDDYEWSFKTIETKPPIITSVAPDDLAQNVLINIDILVTFNEPMNKTSVESGFTVTPEISGFIIWSGQDTTLTFSPETTFNGSTTYIVNITTLAKDKVGNSLDGNENGLAEGSPIDDHSWSFTTAAIPDDEPPHVISIYPANGAADVNKSSMLIVTFNEKMNKIMTETGFSIIPYVDGTYSWDIDDRKLTFTSTSDLNYETEYIVKLIGITVRDPAGNTLDGNNNSISEGSPTDDYSWTFTTEPEPVVEIIYPTVISVFPLKGAIDIDVDTDIDIIFSKDMDMVSTQFAFSISPAVTGIFNWDLTKLIYDPADDLAYETTYTIQITSDATDVDGNALDGNNNSVSEGSPYDDFEWFFTTTSGPDLEKYNLSITGTTKISIQLGENKSYPITITNLGTLEDMIIPRLDAGSISGFASLSDTSPRSVGAGNSWAINLNLAISTGAIPGKYNITIEASSDNGGFTKYHTIEVTILPIDEPDEPDSDDSDNGSDSIMIYGLILVIVVICIVVIILAIFLKKRKSQDQPSPQPQYPQPPPPSAIPVTPTTPGYAQPESSDDEE
jgi:hypothetical protein